MKNFKFNLSMRNHFFVDRVLSLSFALTTGLMAVPFVNAKAVVSEDAVYSLQQDRNTVCKGRVVDLKGEPLIGVTVQVKNANETVAGTVTDIDGNFTINVSASSSLLFSYIGYKPQVIKAKNQMMVTLEEDSQNLEEVIVVGYGQQKKSDLSSSISVVDVNQVKAGSVLPNVANALEGTTPGVSVTTSSGAPGAGVNIRIRGISSFSDSEPLVIIDGAPGNLNDVNSGDIESLQVLKDAASAAIYGSRAANGVIIVTTKKGKAGKVNVEFNTSLTMQMPGKKMDIANAEEYAVLNNAARQAAGKPIYDCLSDPASLGKGTDFQDEFYDVAPLVNTYLSISGGNDNSTYRLSGSFIDQQGIAVTSKYQKFVLSYAGQQKKGAFTFGENIGFTKFKKNSVPDWLIQGLLVAQPIIPLYDSENECGFGGVPSEIANQGTNVYGMAKLVDNHNINANLNFDVYAQVNFLKDFNYKINVGYKNWWGHSYSYTPSYYMSTNVQKERATLSETRSETAHLIVENTLMYKKVVAGHSFDALLGYTFERDKSRNLGGSAEGFPNNWIKVIDASTKYGINATGGAGEWDMISVLARFLYNYKSKYYLTANVRRDGSSRFAKNNRWGTFPSFSVAWRVSSESFFESIRSVVNDLKIRASYGVLGNQPGGNYAYIATGGYATNLGYLFGNGSDFIRGASINGYTDTNIQWERTKSTNIGFDANLFDCISLTANYFYNKTDKLLMGVPIAPSIGGGSPITNTGKMRNKGFEFNASYHSSSSHDFQYNISANLSTVSNKVLKMGTTGETLYGDKLNSSNQSITGAREGYPIGSFFLKHSLGIFQSQEEIDNYKDEEGKLIQPNAAPGDIKYLDANKDGVINGSDAIFSGSPFPDFSYGLNFSGSYKDFDFTIFLQGTYGNKMFDANTHRLHNSTTDFNLSKDLLNAWTPENTNTNIPRLILTDPNHNTDPSTRFLSDASYLRVKTLQVGYTFPTGLIKKIGLNSLRVYLSANNLFTITGYDGYDPSYTSSGLLNAGLDQSIYPLAKNVTCGFTLRF